MQAIVINGHGGSDQLQLQDVPLPLPGVGEVRVKVRFAGINFADVLTRRGGYDAGTAPPFVPGLDCVGTVDALGEGMSRLHVGQRVAAFTTGGSYASHALAREVLSYPLPDTVPDEAAAALTPLVTALGALTLAGRASRRARRSWCRRRPEAWGTSPCSSRCCWAPGASLASRAARTSAPS